MITCRELLDFLHEYLGSEMTPERRATFEEHLAVCPPCVRYIESYKETVRLARDALHSLDAAVPADVPADLVRAIVAARKK